MKAIMIVDIPDNCNKELLSKTPASITFNHGTYKTLLYVEGYLKPMPQKKDAFEECMKLDMMTTGKISEAIVWQVQGYNTCIDEILGDTE